MPAPFNHAPSVEEANAQLPDYEVTAFLGAGGMGAVYRATQLNLNREVALKLFPAASARGDERVERFREEASVLAQLNHPNIVSIFGFGKTLEGTPFFVMELVEGHALEALAEAGVVSAEDVFDAVEATCAALAYAHRRGVVHRDVKPSNLLVASNGMTKLADFGLALMSDASGGSTTGSTSSHTGTPQYMAPEQLGRNDAEIDHRADLYSLGAVLYQALTGRLPVGRFAPLSKLRPELGPAFDRVMGRALATRPEDRYADAGEMGADLRTARCDPHLRTSEGPPPQPAIAEPTRRRSTAVVGVIAAVVALIAGAVAIWKMGGAPEAREPATATAEPVASPVAGVGETDGPAGEPDPPSATSTVTEPGAAAAAPTAPEPDGAASSAARAPIVLAAQRSRDSAASDGGGGLAVTPPAPGAASPSVPATPPAPEMETGSAPVEPPSIAEFTALDDRYRAAIEDQVRAPSVAELAKLDALYLGHLQAAQATAGDAATSTAFQQEIDRLSRGEADSTFGIDDSLPADLATLREVYLSQRAELRATEQSGRDALTATFVEQLAELESDLTRAGRIEDALGVRRYRRSLTPSSVTSPPAE